MTSKSGAAAEARGRTGAVGGVRASRLASLMMLSLLVASCAKPGRIVYSSGFSFGNYDYIVINKPTDETSTSLWGMDVEFANLMDSFNMKVIGDKELASLPLSQQKRTLQARLSLTASGEFNQLSVSFDDAVTGRTAASITVAKKGNIFDNDDRVELVEQLSDHITASMVRDRRLKVEATNPTKR